MRPTTTGGSPNPVLKAVIRRLRQGNEETATHAPIGTPGMTLATLAVMEMKSDCRIIAHVSGSPVTNSKIASTNPDPSSPQYSQLSAPMLHLQTRWHALTSYPRCPAVALTAAMINTDPSKILRNTTGAK